jgi:hypothetical protein
LTGLQQRFSELGYACMASVLHQFTCVRKLNSDYISVDSNITLISQPDQAQEQSAAPVQEGQYALYFGGKIYIHCLPGQLFLNSCLLRYPA